MKYISTAVVSLFLSIFLLAGLSVQVYANNENDNLGFCEECGRNSPGPIDEDFGPDPEPIGPKFPGPIEPLPGPIILEPTPNNGGGSIESAALSAIAVVGLAVLISHNRTAIKNGFFLNNKDGMGFDLNKYGKLRLDSYIPNKKVGVGVLSHNVNLNKSIDFGLRSTFVSTRKRMFNATLAYSF